MTDPTRISDDQHNNAPAVPNQIDAWNQVRAEAKKLSATGLAPLLAAVEAYGFACQTTPSPAPAVPQGYPVLPDYVEDAVERCKNMPGHPPVWVDMMRAMRKALGAATAAPSQPAVPQGWTKAADQVPLEADGEVFIRFTEGSIGTGWATYWHGASNEFAQWTFPDPDEDRTVLEWTKNPATPAPAPAQLTDEEIADIQDRLVAVSGYVADQDDRSAQAILKGTLKMLAAIRAKGAV